MSILKKDQRFKCTNLPTGFFPYKIGDIIIQRKDSIYIAPTNTSYTINTVYFKLILSTRLSFNAIYKY